MAGKHGVQFNLEGFEDLNKNLLALKRSHAVSVVRRTLIAAAKPTVDMARGLAPVDDGQLRDGIGAGTKLTPRQMRKHRKNKGDVTVFVGAGAPHSHLVEFGTSPRINKGKFAGSEHPGSAPKPFMRPAWEATKGQVLEEIKKRMWIEITRRVRLNKNAEARKFKKD